MVELTPNAQAWAIASSLGNPTQSIFVSSFIDELLEGFAETDEELLSEIVARHNWLLRAGEFSVRDGR